jgi:hypothetical protein
LEHAASLFEEGLDILDELLFVELILGLALGGIEFLITMLVKFFEIFKDPNLPPGSSCKRA